MVDSVLFNMGNFACLLLLLSLIVCLFVLRLATPGVLRSWRSLKEDAREGAYESACSRLRNAEQEIVRLKGAVAVHRSKRERAEAVLDNLAPWMVKLADLLRGEFVFCSIARLCW